MSKNQKVRYNNTLLINVLTNKHRGVAQLVECSLWEREAVSSSLTAPTHQNLEEKYSREIKKVEPKISNKLNPNFH